jgi:hypothetical protein
MTEVNSNWPHVQDLLLLNLCSDNDRAVPIDLQKTTGYHPAQFWNLFG